MTSRLLSLFIWLAVATSAVFWGLRGAVKADPVPSQALLAGAPMAPTGGDLSRLLGRPLVQAAEQPALVAAEARFRLIGVVAPRAGQASGLALIAVDGKPPRTVGVGREVEPGLRLLSVSQRQAELGAGGSAPRMTLTLPMLAEPNRGRPADGLGRVMPGQPALLPNGLPAGLPGAAPVLPPAMAQRLQGLPGMGQSGLPARAMPSEASDDGQAQQFAAPAQAAGPPTR